MFVNKKQVLSIIIKLFVKNCCILMSKMKYLMNVYKKFISF
jgi:hypothetical protein